SSLAITTTEAPRTTESIHREKQIQTLLLPWIWRVAGIVAFRRIAWIVTFERLPIVEFELQRLHQINAVPERCAIIVTAERAIRDREIQRVHFSPALVEPAQVIRAH